MSQADVVAGAELRQIAVAKSVLSLDGEFHFAAVDESETGQIRRGGYGEKHGDRSGCEASTMSWERGFGPLEDQGMDGGLAGGDDSMLGGAGSGDGEGFQVDRTDHGSLSDESRGCVAPGADLMVLEGRVDDGSTH